MEREAREREEAYQRAQEEAQRREEEEQRRREAEEEPRGQAKWGIGAGASDDVDEREATEGGGEEESSEESEGYDEEEELPHELMAKLQELSAVLIQRTWRTCRSAFFDPGFRTMKPRPRQAPTASCGALS